MATGAVTYGEIEAYQRLMLTALSPWDVKLIRRLDNAVQAIATGSKPAPTNISGLKTMLRGVAAAKAAQAKAQGDQNA